eukprot:6936948-Alexandrium_andersonii.AAC.1
MTSAKSLSAMGGCAPGPDEHLGATRVARSVRKGSHAPPSLLGDLDALEARDRWIDLTHVADE